MQILTNSASRFLGGRFAPNKLARLALWLKADAIGLADAAPIGTWSDSSGNGRDFVQAGADAIKPVLKTGILNGYPVARYDGDCYLENAAFSVLANAAAATLFAVVKITTTGFTYVFATNTVRFALKYQNGVVTIYAGNAASSSDGTATVSLANYAIVAVRYDGSGANNDARVKLWVNGVAQTITHGGTVPATLGASTTAMIGRYPVSAAGFFNGDQAEFALYTAALSDAERQFVQSYLSAKYGIALTY